MLAVSTNGAQPLTESWVRDNTSVSHGCLMKLMIELWRSQLQGSVVTTWKEDDFRMCTNSWLAVIMMLF